MSRRLLLLSNSTLPGEPFLSWPAEAIRTFLGDSVQRVLFVPYAGVQITLDDYSSRVRDRFTDLGYALDSIHEQPDPVDAVQNAEAIVVGGGNTFHLVAHLHQYALVTAIASRVLEGAPYVGWSAGANVACPTLSTTNDMPIVEPESFTALDLVPFQINPHFTDATIPNHGGETRSERIAEFVTANPTRRVIGLPEGTGLRIEGDSATFVGEGTAMLFQYGAAPQALNPDDLSHLLADPVSSASG
ncbi:MAG: dipeptidase PepE [Bacteroidota bacterium]